MLSEVKSKQLLSKYGVPFTTEIEVSSVADVVNAANEIAVYAFLKNRIGFLDMTDLIERTLEKIEFIAHPSLDDYYETDGAARDFAASLIQL